MTHLARAYNLLFRIAEIVLALVAFVLCGAVIIAVFSRYVMNASVPWSDELPALALIWLTFLGSAVLSRHNEHMAFDGLSAALPVPVQRVFEVFNGLLILGFLAILVHHSWLLTMQTWSRAAVTLPVTMGWVRLIVPVSGVLMMLVYTIRVVRAALGLPLPESEDVN